jgi:hypothetical protein
MGADVLTDGEPQRGSDIEKTRAFAADGAAIRGVRHADRGKRVARTGPSFSPAPILRQCLQATQFPSRKATVTDTPAHPRATCQTRRAGSA